MDSNEYPENVQKVARHARSVLREWLPQAKETKDTPARMFAYAYGPGYRGVVCTLILSKTGIKLGIPWGASSPDTHKVLRGAGKVHRHVQLKSIEDLQQPGIRELVSATYVWARRSNIFILATPALSAAGRITSVQKILFPIRFSNLPPFPAPRSIRLSCALVLP